MINYKSAYNQLNKEQRQAVDTIDGPLLVIAGPGTGKTQLLSTRVANILQITDTSPENILCLTFTESGAQNMRDRLTSLIGKTAYDVQIGTYHAFGGDLIQQYRQYFLEQRLDQPIDELGRHQIVHKIVQSMSYRDPLKQTQYHIKDLVAAISEVKRALLSPNDLRAIAAENQQFITQATTIIHEKFASLATMSSYKQAFPVFESIVTLFQGLIPSSAVSPMFGSLAQRAYDELVIAVQTAAESHKTTSLTKWKNTWLAKDKNNRFIIAGQLENERIIALADVLAAYQIALQKQGLFDFDDMIVQSITALETNEDFKFTLQEKFQYILLDEFQDTNAAQLRLIKLLTDNPVHEGRPNVMAVGDDDQAIYAFQGANYSNMIDFFTMYRDVHLINLTHNYRSNAAIIESAQNIVDQIGQRLDTHFPTIKKSLVPTIKPTAASSLQRLSFISDLGQHAWIAERIKQLINQGVQPTEIAVLAPKHRYLEPLVSHLNHNNIPMRYEKRENILESPIIVQLIAMTRLVLAIREGDTSTANALWPQVISYDFWEIPVSAVWQLSWEVADNRTTQWTEAALNNATVRPIALLICGAATKSYTEPSETILDILIGNEPLHTNESDTPTVQSPLKRFYTDTMKENSSLFYDALSQLTVLRSALRDQQKSQAKTLLIDDFIGMIDAYAAADERLLNSSPYNQMADAVQLMTVFKAKGLEFEHVFLIDCLDEAWGRSSRSNSNRLTLPPNLAPIRHAGATDDERLRALFVGMTRAKQGLYLTSYSQTYSGKNTKPLSYLDEQQQTDGSHRCMILPEPHREVIYSTKETPALEQLETHWSQKHLAITPHTDLSQILQNKIKRLQLSPTHLNSFVDTIHGGPEAFLLHTILRFPHAPSISGQYGSAIHETLEWIQSYLNSNRTLPNNKKIHDYFTSAIKHKGLTNEQELLLAERGWHALDIFMEQRGSTITAGNVPEHNFRHEGVFTGEAQLTGKIDLLEINEKAKSITVVDYKTGASYERWKNDAKLHKYKQQLYVYKLLVEGSHSYKHYHVSGARLEFVEPDKNGDVHTLELQIKPEELERTQLLLQAMWQCIQRLEFPNVSNYSEDLKGIIAFEDYLLETYS